MGGSRISVGRGAIGVLSEGGRHLMVRRAEGIAKAGYWCFPGGHVEAGETPRDAVCRELAEELGIVVRATRRLGSVRLEDGSYVLAVWLVEHVGGELQPAQAEIAEVGWYTSEEARLLKPYLASNDRVFDLMC